MESISRLCHFNLSFCILQLQVGFIDTFNSMSVERFYQNFKVEEKCVMPELSKAKNGNLHSIRSGNKPSNYCYFMQHFYLELIVQG